jgi:hypothetical protein
VGARGPFTANPLHGGRIRGEAAGSSLSSSPLTLNARSLGLADAAFRITRLNWPGSEESNLT